jgi:hypothetical protein
MSNIDVFIRTADGERKPFASLNSAQQVIEMHELLLRTGVYCEESGLVKKIELQAVLDDDAGFELIVMTE